MNVLFLLLLTLFACKSRYIPVKTKLLNDL